MAARRYPAAERVDVVDSLFDRQVADPYRWLESMADQRTVVWCAEQDRLAAGVLGQLSDRETVRRRLADLSAVGEIGLPIWRGRRAFYGRRDASADNAGLVVREPDGTERVLIDPAELDPTGGTTLEDWYPSLEGDRVAYLVSGDDEKAQLYILDVDTDAVLEGPIDRCRSGDLTWLPGGERFIYVRQLPVHDLPPEEEGFHRRVYQHTIGTDPDSCDVELLGAGLDITNYYWFASSSDGRWLVVHAAAGTAPRTEVWLAALSAAGPGELRAIQSGVDAWTLAWVVDRRLCLLTDRDAPLSRLCVADPDHPAYENWRDAIPEDPTATLADAVMLDDGIALAVHGLDASSRIAWYSPTGERLGVVEGLGVGAVSAVMCRPEGGREAWLSYSDFSTPSLVLRWTLDEPGSVTTWQAAPGTADLPPVRVVRSRFTSPDGTGIHAFIIGAADAAPGPRPTILTGYGGFGSSQAPEFTPAALAWVQAGGVWVVPNLRGGSEYGEEWHRAGMREHKQNVFDDVIAVAVGLIDEGWTTPEQLGIMGGSNGGLLVGAAIVQRPELFAAAVCSAPLLDMARYELFGIGRTWNEEYGSALVAEELDWLLAYSPYHHVRPGTSYPAVLFTVADADARVDPMHARKMCAALQHATTGSRPIVLRRDHDGGHVARSVSQSTALAVDQLAFLADQLRPVRVGTGPGRPG